jgi:hypothetical protein
MRRFSTQQNPTPGVLLLKRERESRNNLSNTGCGGGYGQKQGLITDSEIRGSQSLHQPIQTCQMIADYTDVECRAILARDSEVD